MTQFFHDVSFGQKVFRVHSTCFQSLDGYRGGIIPQSFPHLSKLAVTKLSDKLKTSPVYLPLVPCVVAQVRGHGLLNLLNARLPKVNTKSIRVSAVMLNQLLKRSESCPPGDEKSSIIELSYSVMFDSVSVSDRQGIIIAPRLRVSDQKCSVF